MKKRFAFITVIFILLCLTLSLSSCVKDKNENCFAKSNVDFYLICGFDDASNNTDALILAGYDQINNSFSLIQIPRDTYYINKEYEGKINGIYPSCLSRGLSREESLEYLKGTVKEMFGIEINGYIGYTTTAVHNIVDSLGGVDITVKNELSYLNKNGEKKVILNKGENHLNGKDALELLRFREGYLLADLGRMDAQKLFLSALMKKVITNSDPLLYISLFTDRSQGLITDCDFFDIYNIGIKNIGRIKKAKFLYATLPGESCRGIDGGWYYVANRPACEKLLADIGINVTVFDKEERLLSLKNSNFSKIYNSNKIKYKVYDQNSLDDIQIKIKE